MGRCMIIAKLNRPEYEYDIHSLIRAFYPKQKVSCTSEEKAYDEPADLVILIDYGDDCISINGYEKGEDRLPEHRFEVDFSDRRETKNRLKQELYRMLSNLTQTKLPWGTLTGIRPTKIPMKLLLEGKGEDEIQQYMSETYFSSKEKTDLSIAIAKRELSLLNKLDYEHGYSLYIGIPFCPTTCLYCSFTSYPLSAWESRVDDYLDALEKEIDFTAVKFYHKRLNSVYIGGGTPTTLSPRQLDRLLRKIKCSFDFSDCLEFTVEAGRPDSITKDKLKVLKEWGVTRISVNPQTMRDETLRLIGRRHTAAQTEESFYLARELGFDNINMDLILGLPGETLEDVRYTMECMKALRPDNLTVHSLARKRAARLTINREEYQDYEMVNTAEHMNLTASYAADMGMVPYYLYRQKSMAGNMENVGYALPGKEGLYNILIMEEKQTIMALGAGAATKFVIPAKDTKVEAARSTGDLSQYINTRVERVENVKDVSHYLERVDGMIERKMKKMEELSWH